MKQKEYSSMASLAHSFGGLSLLQNNNKESLPSLVPSIISRILTAPSNSVIMQPSRTITRISQRGGKMKTSKMILQRYRRLGNGLWIHRQAGYKKRLWKKLLKNRSSAIIWKLRRHVICNEEQSLLLDKLVTASWKKQKWYVEDPYKGYTDESLFYYHPASLPGNTTDELDDHYRYGIRRINRGKELLKQRKRGHGKHIKHCKRQKSLPNANRLFV
uniref:Large ribosomal subunit protein bL35m n=1 Tax=Ciona savignyi TaxID=51511 RepID=H2ZDW5_CIOSA